MLNKPIEKPITEAPLITIPIKCHVEWANNVLEYYIPIITMIISDLIVTKHYNIRSYDSLYLY